MKDYFIEKKEIRDLVEVVCDIAPAKVVENQYLVKPCGRVYRPGTIITCPVKLYNECKNYVESRGKDSKVGDLEQLV